MSNSIFMSLFRSDHHGRSMEFYDFSGCWPVPDVPRHWEGALVNWADGEKMLALMDRYVPRTRQEVPIWDDEP